MTLLDIGCGWGGGMQRAIETYDINVIGLTLSRSQRDYAEAKLAKVPTHRHVEVRLQGWEEFEGKVDRIVCIGAFEHFGHERYDAFFDMAYNMLPDDGSMLLHTICGITQDDCVRLGIPITLRVARFVKFIITEIFPGGRIPTVTMVETHARNAGFRVSRVQSLQARYSTTLDEWAAALEAHRDDAIAVQSQEVYDRYMKYLTGCADRSAPGTSMSISSPWRRGVDPFLVLCCGGGWRIRCTLLARGRWIAAQMFCSAALFAVSAHSTAPWRQRPAVSQRIPGRRCHSRAGVASVGSRSWPIRKQHVLNVPNRCRRATMGRVATTL